MTRRSKKDAERFFVIQAAQFLGKNWVLDPDRENPDFVISEAGHKFGLEVADVFMGRQNRSGAIMKKEEATTQDFLNALRRQYEAIANISLQVRFVGSMSAESVTAVLSMLTNKDLASKPISYHFKIDTGRGLQVHVTKAFRADWYSLNDRVGFVDRYPEKVIAKTIEKKAQRLSKYKNNVRPDIRLLLVANRIHNSGRLKLERPSVFDFKGFQAVYFFSYPELRDNS